MSTTETNIKGTQTEQNIVKAFVAETQAYARYTFYAKAADKEGYFPVGQIFRDSADNELHHAKVFLKMLQNDEVQSTGMVDAGFLGKTADNLAVAIKEEATEGYEAYTAAAATALKEGFPEIASHFTAIAEVEKHHHDRFQRCLDLINSGTMWKREYEINWICLVCGYVYRGKTPPETCPGCDHPYQHYMPEDLLVEPYKTKE